MKYVGYATVSKTPSDATRYLWGSIEEIAGKELPVIERNNCEDCLCYVDGKGLVDVNHTDVSSYRENTARTMNDLLLKTLLDAT